MIARISLYLHPPHGSSPDSVVSRAAIAADKKADGVDLESKGSILFQVLDKFVHVAQILTEQALFLVGRL